MIDPIEKVKQRIARRETRLTTPDNPLEEAKKQFQDSPLTGVTNLANTISNTVDVLDGKEGNRPFVSDISKISEASKKGDFLSPNIHEPEYGKALDVIDATTKGKPAIWENIPQDIRDRLKDNKTIFRMPSGREIDPITKKALGILLAPPTSFATGIQSGGEKVKEGVDAIGKGDIAGGTFAIINGLTTSGFAGITPLVPVLAGFAIANKVAEDVGLGEEANTVMSPFAQTFNNQVTQEIKRLKSEGRTPEEISEQLGVSLTAVKEDKSILGENVAETADLIYNLMMFGKVHKVGKSIKGKIEGKTIKDFSVDRKVLDSMNPKLQGEKQIDVRQEKAEVLKEKIEEVKPIEEDIKTISETEAPVSGEVVKKIEKRTDKNGKEYYFDTEAKKRTSKAEYEKVVPEEKVSIEPIKEDVKIVEPPKVETPKSGVKEKTFDSFYDIHNAIKEKGVKIGETVKLKSGESVKVEPVKTGELDAIGQRINYRLKKEQLPETPVVNATIERLRKEATDELNNVSAGFNPQLFSKSIQIGAIHLKNGMVKFTDWSKQMVKDLGEKVKPQLLRIWNEVKKFGADLGKIAVDKIGEFVESKYNVARPLKMVEGEMISADSPLARQLNKPKGKEVKVTVAEENTRRLRTADQYQKLLTELPEKPIKEQKEILKKEVADNPYKIDYNIFKPSNRGKDKNPLVRGAYQLLFDKREQFKKDFDNFIKDTNTLIREARHSRTRFQLVRQDTQVIDYLQGKTKWKDLRPQEQKLASYLKEWFKEVEPTMTNKNAREQYITHIKRGFLETWQQEGLWSGVKGLFKEQDKNWESQTIADIDLMMAKEKFNPFAITRKGQMPYSKDLGKILETYGKIFFLKKHFDNVRPQINILNNLLGEAGMTREKNFLKLYAKKMVGENIDTRTPEGMKKVSSALMKFTALRFLAWNIPAGIINTAAGIVDNFINIPVKELALGNARFETTRGQKIIRNNNVVDVENLDAAIGLRQQLGKSIDMMLFLPMRGAWKIPWGEHYIQGSAYLGLLTKQEFRTGKVSLSRHREILEKIGDIHGAYRDVLSPDAKQTLGTREGLQFKLWMLAKVTNRWDRYVKGLAKPLLTGNFKDIKPENLRTIAKELALVASAIMVMTDDDNPVKDAIQDIMSDLYGSLDPRQYKLILRRGIPAVGTLADLLDLVETYFTQEEYKTSNKKYGIKKGDLKATKKLERMIPLYRQYKRLEGGEKSGTTGGIKLPEIKIPEYKLPELKIPEYKF